MVIHTINIRSLSLPKYPLTMKMFYVLVLPIITFTACSSPATSTPGKMDSLKPAAAIPHTEKPAENLLADTAQVKAWLTKVIEDYTHNDTSSNHFEVLRKSLTDDYYNYKQDALNMEYDSDDTPLTAAGFQKKWQGKFNTKYVGPGGFIISAQDNGKIKVTLHLIQQVDQQASLYKVFIEDLDFKSTYNRDIKVITQDGKFLIADIVEYN